MFALSHYVTSLLPVPSSMDHLALYFYKEWDEPKTENVVSHAIILSLGQLCDSRFKQLWTKMFQANPGIQIVLIADNQDDLENHFAVLHEFPIFRIFESFDGADLETSLFEAVEQSNSRQQEATLQKMLLEQMTQLKELTEDLEQRVVKRQKFLEESRRKNLIAQHRWQTLKKFLELTAELKSVSDMEKQISELLKESLNIAWVRINLLERSPLAHRDVQGVNIYQADLFQDMDVWMGKVTFARERDWPFSNEEKEFLLKISEAISLTIRRIHQMEITRTLKEQWQATFNAVQNPIALINSKYDVVQSNTAFMQKAKSPASVTAGQKCYQILFDRDTPCSQCHLGENFRLETKSRSVYWDVTSQHLKDRDDEVLFFNQYEDVSEKLRIESRVLQSAKLAELGLIGSSIAHELNNPLGGVLSFVQMIKMDHTPEDSIWEDLCQIEDGVKRCRDIVKNLLGFSRQPSEKNSETFDLRETIELAISIVEIRTRASNVNLRRRIMPTEMRVLGNKGQLAQAVTSLLQMAVDSAARVPKSAGLVEVSLAFNQNMIELQISDNGPGPDGAPNLVLPMAHQIIVDHQGNLENLNTVRGLRIIRVTLSKASSPENTSYQKT